VAKMEQTVDVFKTLMTKGVGGLWEWIKDKIGDFQDLVFGGIKDFIIERVIKGGITWMLSLLNPAAAFIKACKAIYDIVMFIVERGSQIMEFVNSVLDSIGSIARGQLSVAAEKVEGALAKALPLTISFLASLLGLGGITEKIKEGIDKVRKPIEKAVDFVVMGAVKGFKKMFGGAIGWVKDKAAKGKAWVKDKATAAKDWAAGKAASVKARLTGGAKTDEEHAAEGVQPPGDDHFVQTVTMHGAQHTVEADLDGSVTMASKKGGIVDKAKRRLDMIKKDTPVPQDEVDALESIITVSRRVTLEARRARGESTPGWDGACRELIDAISDYGQRFNATDLDPPETAAAAGPVDMEELLSRSAHVRPRDYSRGKHVKGVTEAERRESSKENGQFLASLSDAQIAEMERDTLLTGDVIDRGGGSFHAYKEYPAPIGYDQEQDAFILRAELSAFRIHSHPRLRR